MLVYLAVTDDNQTYYSWLSEIKLEDSQAMRVSTIDDIKNLSCVDNKYQVRLLSGHRETEIYNSMDAQHIINQLIEGTYTNSICSNCEYFQQLPEKGNFKKVDICMAGKELNLESCSEFEAINHEKRNKAKAEIQSKVRFESKFDFGGIRAFERQYRREFYNEIQQQLHPEIPNFADTVNSMRDVEAFLTDFVYRRQPRLIDLNVTTVITRIMDVLNREINRIYSYNGYRPTHLVIDADSYMFIQSWMQRSYYTAVMFDGHRTRELSQMLGIEVIRSVPEGNKALIKILTIPES